MAFDETEAGSVCQQMLLSMSCALDGRLRAHEQTVLAEHLAACAACRSQAVELGAADRLFRAMNHLPAVPLVLELDFVSRVMSRVRLDATSPGGIREFVLHVLQDPSLHEQFRQAGNLESLVAQFVSAGQQQGYQFGGSEVVRLLNTKHAANDELSDAQLDGVVGGVGAHDATLLVFIDELNQLFKPMD